MHTLIFAIVWTSGLICASQGLAIITVLKAGFLGSARYGNGIVVARLADGSWSAPSAIGLGGAGFGGQIGFELTGEQRALF